jgi:hypothetical protein
MFASPAYQALGLKKTRYFIGWDAFIKKDLARPDAFVAAANAAGVKVLMHISDSDFGRNQGKLPSVREYRREVGKIVRRYKRMGVREWGVWNEANHDSQSTYKNPKRAAQFFGQMRAMCKGCRIVALDVLDQRDVTGYIRRWYAAIPRGQRKLVKIVGIHNYSDTNRYRSRGTAAIIKEVKRIDRIKTAFWLTETGGVVSFAKSFRAIPPRRPRPRSARPRRCPTCSRWHASSAPTSSACTPTTSSARTAPRASTPASCGRTGRREPPIARSPSG